MYFSLYHRWRLVVYLLDKKSAKLHTGYLMEAFWTLSSSRGCTGSLVMWVALLSLPYIILGISRESDQEFSPRLSAHTRNARPLAWCAFINFRDSQGSLSKG